MTWLIVALVGVLVGQKLLYTRTSGGGSTILSGGGQLESKRSQYVSHGYPRVYCVEWEETETITEFWTTKSSAEKVLSYKSTYGTDWKWDGILVDGGILLGAVVLAGVLVDLLGRFVWRFTPILYRRLQRGSVQSVAHDGEPAQPGWDEAQNR